VSEPGSDLVDAWLRTDDAVCTWALTRVELASAVERRAREGSIGVGQRRDALRAITDLADAASEVIDVESVRARAVSLLARHALRAADAAQLAAALVVVEGGVRGLPFVCFDRRLSDAASREGFEVLSWEQ
jgi:predicted nucleic acid-binding protein